MSSTAESPPEQRATRSTTKGLTTSPTEPPAKRAAMRATSNLHTISQPDNVMEEWDGIHIPHTSTTQIVEHLQAMGAPKDDKKEDDKTKDTTFINQHRLTFTSPTTTAAATIPGPIDLDSSDLYDDQTLDSATDYNAAGTMTNPHAEIPQGAAKPSMACITLARPIRPKL